jgi:hypothetical protein
MGIRALDFVKMQTGTKRTVNKVELVAMALLYLNS